MKIGIPVALTSLALSAFFLTGCGGGDAGGESPSTEETSAAATTPSSATVEVAQQPHRLTGVWLGAAYIEEEKLQAKLNGLTDEAAKQNLILQVQTFKSMLVGADFGTDGSFTLDAEITPAGGQPARDQSKGQWEISSTLDEMVMVKSTEAREDGSAEETFKQYNFIDDDHFYWVPTLSEDLQACDAMIVFERQPETTEVATEPASEPSLR